jgi:tRNA-specific 2-thiouridylase
VKCNQTVKFRDLHAYAQELNADALVTGHYVNRIQNNGSAEMYRAADLTRDQSYFLFTTTQEQLNFLRFPLGVMYKKDTRKIASELNLNVADKPDSQDICFVPNGNYASVIKKYRPESFKEGDILDTKGKVIGKHEGIINFTIGQRKGIGISHEEPLYVVNIIAKENKVIVGNREALSIKKIYLKDINLLSDIENHSDGLFIKVRSTGKLIKAKITLNKTEAEVNLDEDEIGISPGQACVFYSINKFGDKVLGGGWITRTVNKYLST